MSDDAGCHCRPNAAPPSSLWGGRWLCDWCGLDTDPYREDELTDEEPSGKVEA